MDSDRDLGVDAATAAALGWPKLKYAWVERERRWLCAALPAGLSSRAEVITDLYVTGTRLRLREAAPLDGGPVMRRLGRKADVNPSTRLLTSLYLAPEEFALLVDLPGRVIRKTRHHLDLGGGVDMAIDVFEGPLAGLIMAEAEFETAAAMAAFVPPAFVGREVTEDAAYTGGALAEHGLPTET